MIKLAMIMTLLTASLTADLAKLTVEGQALLKKPSDIATLNLGVTTEAENAEAALKQNSERMNAIIESLQGKQHQTGSFTITPVYKPRPQNLPPNWKDEISGYRVENTLSITTEELQEIGLLIDRATQAGANTVHSLVFSLKNPRQYRSEAITEAAKNALADAKTLADATGVKIVKILALDLDQQHLEHRFSPNVAFLAKATPIEAGDVDISARVTLVAEIED